MTSSENTPACVFEPATAQDVSVAIKILGSTRTQFAVMSGGHTGNAGFSSVGPSGVHISFTRMRSVSLSSDKSTCSFGPGNTWDGVYAALDSSGVQVVGGRVSGVGVGGYITGGGGFSWVANSYGLSIDTVSSFQVVLPNGTIATIDSSNPSDLFFGLKGAGNKLGIVTQFTLKTYPSAQINGGLKIYGPLQLAALANATSVFQETNKDPNAQVITTFNGLGGIGSAILLQFYNGANVPAGTFDMFNQATPLINTVKTQTLTQFVQSVPSNLSSGARGSFHSVSITQLSPTFMAQVLNQSAYYTEQALLRSGTLISYDVEPFLVSSYFNKATDSAFPHSSANPWIPLNIYFAWLDPLQDDWFHQAMLDSAAVLEATANAEGDNTSSKPLYPNYALGTTPVERLFMGNLGRLQAVRNAVDPGRVMDLAGGFSF
ncbi:FAD-binding domain-containing protein [Meredithblackwellia eburnea MCA 4105]